MAATALPGPEIQVYASFPLSIVLDANNNLQPTPWQWVHCLTLSVETLRAYQFSPKPYKWLRYAIGVVVGVEGDLSFSSESPNVVDYDSAGLPTESIALYYHASDEERQRMFPIDPNIGRTNITSSVATARRTNFRNDVADRDGWEDILTSGMDEGYCIGKMESCLFSLMAFVISHHYVHSCFCEIYAYRHAARVADQDLLTRFLDAMI